MAKVIIALGSNLDNPLIQLRKAAGFLENLSLMGLKKSSIFESEPIGPSEQRFLNAVLEIQTQLPPLDVLTALKNREIEQGRSLSARRWSARPLDLDILFYDDVILTHQKLHLPHKYWAERLFVLLPLADLFPDWKDPFDHIPIQTWIDRAPEMDIHKTDLVW
ncbi:MAG: 2-amino-4-hydroxy-6-hydroxymethyldihydropteridine diphosphokinase [Bacteroidota bacterium]